MNKCKALIHKKQVNCKKNFMENYQDEELEISLNSLLPTNATKYNPRYDELALKYLQLHKGASIKDLASFLMISTQTLKSWVIQHLSFGQAIHKGMEASDTEVAAALFKMAVHGVEYTEEVAFYDKETGQTIVQEVRKVRPP
jgi:hypothetical protein